MNQLGLQKEREEDIVHHRSDFQSGSFNASDRSDFINDGNKSPRRRSRGTVMGEEELSIDQNNLPMISTKD